MPIQRMEHVGIVVDDLAAAAAFFVELGLELQGEWSVEGDSVDRIVGLEGVRVDAAMMETPDGHGRLELIKFHAPSSPGGDRQAPANTPGLRHLAFAVDDIDAAVAGVRAHGGAHWRGGGLRRHVSALLRPRSGGDHRRAGGADRLRAPAGRRGCSALSKYLAEDGSPRGGRLSDRDWLAAHFQMLGEPALGRGRRGEEDSASGRSLLGRRPHTGRGVASRPASAAGYARFDAAGAPPTGSAAQCSAYRRAARRDGTSTRAAGSKRGGMQVDGARRDPARALKALG
jgi:catechol 2,3-dioxygenase-like lactoylglutathione lyase family enzyme